MKTYELESFLKSFLIFLILLEVLLAINFWYEFQGNKTQIKEKVQIEMKLCAFTIQCEGLKTDFIEKGKDKEQNILYQNSREFYSFFNVPKVKKFLMKVSYPKLSYLNRIEHLKDRMYKKFLFYSMFAALVSFLFSFYALMPLRKALHLNEEFVKDILHDFNTPISSMRINLKLFKKEIGENQKIQRLENNIETILSLQNNLQIFLKGIATQSESFNLKELLENRVSYFRVLYPDITYSINVQQTILEINKDAFTRIIDNLLSNAGKYNIANGSVSIILDENKLIIRDTGKGIQNPSKVFDRYYKEQERGIGIGLHIVKKLCNELSIVLKITSQKDQGTQIFLDISKIIA